jgi:hypothetical protein
VPSLAVLILGFPSGWITDEATLREIGKFKKLVKTTSF